MNKSNNPLARRTTYLFTTLLTTSSLTALTPFRSISSPTTFIPGSISICTRPSIFESHFHRSINNNNKINSSPNRNKDVNQQQRRTMDCFGSAEKSSIFGGGKGVTVDSITKPATAAVIFLHGLGDSGTGWAPAFPLRQVPHVDTILPNAPSLPVSLNGGAVMPSWFDLHGLDDRAPDDEGGIRRAVQRIHRIVDAIDIPSERIVLAGFSQGGAVALTAGLRSQIKFAGIIALSTWLPLRNDYPETLGPHAKNTKVFYAHGESDVVVPYQFGRASADLIKSLDVPVTFKSYSGMGHSASAQEMEDVAEFLKSVVPKNTS